MLHRDVSDAVQVPGQHRAHVAIVLDVATGVVIKVEMGTARAGAVGRALKDAVIRPAAPVPKTVPQAIVCPPDLIETVSEAAAKLSRLANTTLVEGVEMCDAEEIFDGLVGHLTGRAQPEDRPSIEDWRVLYGALEAYASATPWQRWSDDDYFAMRLELDGHTIERTGIVIGAAGIQRGFNVTPDPESLQRAANDAGNPLVHLEQALIVHLNPRRETSDLFAGKAQRYDWPDDAALFPELLTVRDGQPADLSRDDARLLALSLRAVVAQDTKRLTAVGASPVTGEVAFEDGGGRFEVARP